MSEPDSAIDEPVGAAATIGLWDATHEPEPDAVDGEAPPPGLPVADDELLLARAALDEGRPDDAAVHLAFVIRLAPVLAPVVLDLVGTDPRPALAFVRGDAYRLVGREVEARRAYADAARPDPTPSDDPDGTGRPSGQNADPPEQGDPA